MACTRWGSHPRGLRLQPQRGRLRLHPLRNGNKHGFVPAQSKTDNLKVGDEAVVEIDTRFHEHDHAGSMLLDNRGVTRTDPLGASNNKWSYWAPWPNVFHEAHVEAVEVGTHKITIANQPGCQVAHVVYAGVETGGPKPCPWRPRSATSTEPPSTTSRTCRSEGSTGPASAASEAGARSRSAGSCAGSRSAGRRAATTRSRTSDRFLGQVPLGAAAAIPESLTALPARS